MMRVSAVLLLALMLAWPGRSQGTWPQRPKLVVLIAIDQMRQDYLTRFPNTFQGGLKRLMSQGAVFPNCYLNHYPTVTAVGHATMLSGATPMYSGIVGNDWYDREAKKRVTSVSDEKTKQLGGIAETSASPRRLLVSTVGDELKATTRGAAKVIGISMKDRSAILPAGRSADASYWFDQGTGEFVSSTYYFAELPAWVQRFNASKPADQYAGSAWGASRPIKLPQAGALLYGSIYASPFGNELLASFAAEAVRQEKLGQRETTDLLTVSFSANDALGHQEGPDSPLVEEMTMRTDAVLGTFIATLEKLVGPGNLMVVLTADHGVAPSPEALAERRMPGGRMRESQLWDPVRAALEKKYGAGAWLTATTEASAYFNLALIEERNMNVREMIRFAADTLAALPQVARVYTRDELLQGLLPPDVISQRLARSFNARRSGDLEVLLDPYYIRGGNRATHGTPYNYDAHVPLIFWGPGVRPGVYVRDVAQNDLAPTLATLLGIEVPAASVGRTLQEIFGAASSN